MYQGNVWMHLGFISIATLCSSYMMQYLACLQETFFHHLKRPTWAIVGMSGSPPNPPFQTQTLSYGSIP